MIYPDAMKTKCMRSVKRSKDFLRICDAWKKELNIGAAGGFATERRVT
jgi:hypothetical protein